MVALVTFVGGLVTMGFAIAGLFFLRFWRRTRDGLFLSFAFAFWLFGLNTAVIALRIVPTENQSFVYLLRLAGYALIIVAVIAKNMRASNAKRAKPANDAGRTGS